MRCTALLLLAPLAGCTVFDGLEAASDGASSVSLPSSSAEGANDEDAGELVAVPTDDGGARCVGGSGFASISEVPGSVNEQPITAGLALSQDETTIYFVPAGKTGMARARRTDASGKFAAAEPIVLGANEYGFEPYLSLDGKTLYFSRGGGADGRIGRADVSTTAASLVVDSLPSDVAVATPFLDVPNNAFYTVAYGLPARELGTLVDGRWQAKASLRVSVNGAQLPTRSPVLSPDGLTIYFAAETPMQDAPPRMVVYVARRTSRVTEWQTPTPVAGLTATSWVPSWLSPDGCRLYLANIFQGGWKAFVATLAR